MKRFMTLLALFVLVGSPWLLAQGVEITGLVTGSDDGAPLPGVSIVVQGTTIGTATNFDGEYELDIPEDAQVLVFSYVGMQSQEVAIDARTNIDVILNPDFFNLDEIIVVAYGQQVREAKTGAVGTISSDQLRDIPETSIDRMLDGKVPGVVVSATSGAPGAANQIRIRGTSSIFAGAEPLYVIDGMVAMDGNQEYNTYGGGNALASLNPNDIKSITILKDAAAASIYGSRAANGVVLITTKSGQSGKGKVTLRTSYGFETLANDNDFGPMEFEDWIDYKRDAVTNAGRNPDDPSNSRYYWPESYKTDSTRWDWPGALRQKGQIYNVELAIEGGNERTTHYFSGGYQKHEGSFVGIVYEKFHARLNLDHQVNDWLKAGIRINTALTDHKDRPLQAMYFVNPLFGGDLISPIDAIYQDDGSFNLYIPSWGNTNPLASATYEDLWSKQNRFNGNAYLEIQLMEGLKLKTTNNYEYTGGEERTWWDPRSEGTTLGNLWSHRTLRNQVATSNVLTFNRAFGDHTVQVIAGQEALRYTYNRLTVNSVDADGDIPFPTTSPAASDDGDYFETAYTLASYFGLASYSYANRYYFQGSLRTDGSSRFGADTRWGTFWSAGLSWNLHNEAFLENLSMINQLKVRGSYGLSGNYRIDDYDQYGLYGSNEYNATAGLAPTQPANPDLGWETNAETNIGMDFTLFERVSGTLEGYNRITSDMLLDYPLSRTSGFASIRQNIGELQNRGIEFMIDGQIVRSRDLTWNVGFNVAHNRSEILDLGKDEQFINPGNSRIQHKVGESLYSFYLYEYAGVNPANGEALWINEDGDLTNKYSEANRVILGSPEPILVGGFNTNVSYMGVALDVNLAFKWGNEVLVEEHRYSNSDGNFWLKNQTNNSVPYWKQPGDIVPNPKPVADNSSNSYYYRSSRHMYDGSYLRIKNISLSYSLPQSIVERMYLGSLRIYASASNMYTFHGVEYYDPERGVEGGGFGIYPQTKKYSFGLEVTF